MRKVVETRQVAHLWANKSQDQARNPGGNFSFVGAAIYSYGQHFVIAAHLDNGAILWNDAGYSNTTSKHKSHVANAMTTGQWENRICVPSLNENKYRDLDRKHREGTKVLPDIVQEMADSIIATIEGMAGARMSGKLTGAFYQCKRLESNAHKLIAYVTKGRTAPKWPLAALPDALPADKDARAAWIRSMVKGKLIAQYEKAISEATAIIERRITGVLDSIDGPKVDHWSVRALSDAARSAERYLDRAAKNYSAAYEKQSAKVGTLRKKLAKLAAPIKAATDAYDIEAARYCLNEQSRAAFAELRAQRIKPSPYRRNMLGFIRSKMQDALLTLKTHGLSVDTWQDVYVRIGRADNWQSDTENLKAAIRDFDGAESYLPGFPADALRCLTTARRHLSNAGRSLEFRKFKIEEMRALNLKIDTLRADLEKQILEKNKTAVLDWIEGRSNSIPHGAGTYARIQGNEVVTSHGARVPLSHACRLVRIAQRVIARGGQQWIDGTGPRVGGFQVSSIFADGGAVIGCHEFGATESKRLIELLSSCDACQHVHADETEGV